MSGPYPEKRKALRIQPYVVPCRVVEGSRRKSGYVTELSTDGLRIACEADPPALNSQVVIEVRLARRIAHTRLPGEVRWVRRGDTEGGLNSFGLTFDGITEDERRTLEAVVEDFYRRVQEIEG
jgi:PilZ domain